MSPRKKSKPNPQAPANDANVDSQAEASLSHSPPTTRKATMSRNVPATVSNIEIDSTSDEAGIDTGAADNRQSLNKKASRKWLGGGGSWRSKAPAIVKTAKESIGVAGGATSELPGQDAQKPDESPKKFLTKRKSSKGNAIPASMTKLNVSSDGSIGETPQVSKEPAEPPPPIVNEPPLPPEPSKPTQPASTFGWRSWWSRPDGYSESTGNEDDAARTTPLPGPTPSEEIDAKSKELGNTVLPAENAETKNTPAVTLDGQDTEMKDASQLDASKAKNTASGSWFWLWSVTQNARTDPPIDTSKGNSGAEDQKPDGAEEPALDAQPIQQQPANVAESTQAIQTPEAPSIETAKPSGWAFWFKEKPKSGAEGKSADGTQESIKKVGQVAVFDTPSQSHPEAAQFNEQDQSKDTDSTKESAKPLPDESAEKRSFRSLRGRPKTKVTPKDTPLLTPSSSKTAIPSAASPAPSPTRQDTASASQAIPKQPAKTKQEPSNLVLPEFKSTYRLVQKPTYWQQIRQYFLGDELAMPHLHINPSPTRIKKAVAIGIHGYFPAPIIQKVLGQPTGTSIRFANAAAAAIKDWTEARGYTPEIEQIALEGEGFNAERVKTLWKLLLNWIDHIKEADFILVACHSQGVPVAIMLVAKLIQFGCVNATRIGVCAMAGINMGPFKEFHTRYLGQTAAELFQFGDPKSLVSEMYLAGLDEALRHGVRIFYIGSIDDQLVSLESSTFSVISHPYIYRAVFVDGRIHAPDFLSHLVGFALKLRNLGLPDHGLIRELSPALAGSLYAGEGHSRVYEDPRVYELAVRHALETTSLPIQPQSSQQKSSNAAASFKRINIPIPGAKVDAADKLALRVKEYEASAAGNNPYFLPWAMRGLLEEEFVKKELGQEVEELLNMFEDWKPTTKGLKDVKFRLEAVKSRL